MAYMRLGDLLVSVGLITEQQLQEALQKQKGSGKRLGALLIEEEIISEQALIETLEMQLGIDFIDLSKIHIPMELAQILPKSIARRHSVVPVKLVKDELVLAMADPLNYVAIEEVRTATRRRISPRIATTAAVDRAIATLYGNDGAARAIEEMRIESGGTRETSGEAQTDDLDDETQSAPTVRLVNSIIERAILERASDIHLEPRAEEMVVRMRIDGLLRSILTVPRDLQNAVISRLKIMGEMDIAEHRIPQDGRANVRVKSRDIDLRLSTLPTIYGEKVVIRLLDKDAQLLDASAIGLEGENLEKYESLLKNTSGVILIVGPTGSGKSSTMYTMIRSLNNDSVNLVTLEDPVEYDMDGINQVQINEKTGMTFASGLRSILRQDPDIIAVGEIRDGETAEIAMRAAITGHLVFSTIHTNDAISAVDRLVDIGVEPYLVSEALMGVISQRLVRRICPECSESYTPSEEELTRLGLPADSNVQFHRGKGCAHCYHTGYRGRTAAFEILVLDRALKRAVAEGRHRQELAQNTSHKRFASLAENARRLVLEGVTTAEEAIRVINSTADE